LFVITRTPVRHRPEWLFGFLRNHCSPSPEYALDEWARDHEAFHRQRGEKEMGSNLCLTLDGKIEKNNVDIVLLLESFEA
jgi:hypothetical protein